MKTNQYIALAKKLAPYDRSLNKYKRRKTLKPQEKAAIKRARNKFKGFVDIDQSLNRIKSLNKTQLKALKDKSLIIPGTNSIIVDPNAKKIAIRKGKVIVKTDKFTFHYIPTEKTPDALIGAAGDIFAKDNKRYKHFVAIWFETGAYNYMAPLWKFKQQVEKTFIIQSGYNVPKNVIEGISWYAIEN